jgi:hypothetical protein
VLASTSGRMVVTNICQGVIYSNAVLRESCIDSTLNERTLSEEQAHRCMRKPAFTILEKNIKILNKAVRSFSNTSHLHRNKGSSR